MKECFSYLYVFLISPTFYNTWNRTIWRNFSNLMDVLLSIIYISQRIVLWKHFFQIFILARRNNNNTKFRIFHLCLIFSRFGISIEENNSKKRSSYEKKKKKKLPNFLPTLFSTWTGEHNASIVSCNDSYNHLYTLLFHRYCAYTHKQLVILIQLSTKGSGKKRKQGIYTSITISTSRRTCSSTRQTLQMNR